VLFVGLLTIAPCLFVRANADNQGNAWAGSLIGRLLGPDAISRTSGVHTCQRTRATKGIPILQVAAAPHRCELNLLKLDLDVEIAEVPIGTDRPVKSLYRVATVTYVRSREDPVLALIPSEMALTCSSRWPLTTGRRQPPMGG
jgi:hypothetical protein